jgi:hypothetical protein
MVRFHVLSIDLTKSGHVPNAANRTFYNTNFENIAFRFYYIFMAAVFLLVNMKSKNCEFEENV